MVNVWVIQWSYKEGTGADIIEPAFDSEEKARWLVALLHKMCPDKRFELHRLEVR